MKRVQLYKGELKILPRWYQSLFPLHLSSGADLHLIC